MRVVVQDGPCEISCCWTLPKFRFLRFLQTVILSFLQQSTSEACAVRILATVQVVARFSSFLFAILQNMPNLGQTQGSCAVAGDGHPLLKLGNLRSGGRCRCQATQGAPATCRLGAARWSTSRWPICRHSRANFRVCASSTSSHRRAPCQAL